MRSINVSHIDHKELISSKTGERFSFSAVLSQLVQFNDLFVHHEILPAGRRTSSPHRHSHREEMFFVLEGHPIAHFGDRTLQLSPGDFIGFAPGNSELHFIENHSDSTVRILVIASNPSEDRVETSPDPLFDKIFQHVRLWSGESNTRASDLSDISSLKGGLSSSSLYRFNFKKSNFVLRLLPIQADIQTRIRQISLAEKAGKLGIGPNVHFVHPNKEAIIMDFFQGRLVCPQDFKNLNHLASFAQTLRKLHSSQCDFPIAASPFDRFRNFIQKGKENGTVFPAQWTEIEKFMAETESLLKIHSVSQAPCHLDLHLQNILFNEKDFVLVDWVNGGKSDPYFDLATFSSFLRLNESQDQFLLTNYFDRHPSDFELYRFTIIKPIRLFVIASACLCASPEGRSSTFFEDLTLNEVPNLDTYVSEQMKGEVNWPLWKIGMTMLKTGLDLIQDDRFAYARTLGIKLGLSFTPC